VARGDKPCWTLLHKKVFQLDEGSRKANVFDAWSVFPSSKRVTSFFYLYLKSKHYSLYNYQHLIVKSCLAVVTSNFTPMFHVGGKTCEGQ
jgi:hypothetical protein